VELYCSHECLWNTRCVVYKNKEVLARHNEGTGEKWFGGVEGSCLQEHALNHICTSSYPLTYSTLGVSFSLQTSVTLGTFLHKSCTFSRWHHRYWALSSNSITYLPKHMVRFIPSPICWTQPEFQSFELRINVNRRDGGSKRLWNVGQLLRDYTAQCHTRMSTSSEVIPCVTSVVWYLHSHQLCGNKFVSAIISIKTNAVSKITKNAFEKCLYSKTKYTFPLFIHWPSWSEFGVRRDQ
jgi:hypothetical protein